MILHTPLHVLFFYLPLHFALDKFLQHPRKPNVIVTLSHLVCPGQKLNPQPGAVPLASRDSQALWVRCTECYKSGSMMKDEFEESCHLPFASYIRKTETVLCL